MSAAVGDLFSLREVADATDISIYTLRKWANRGHMHTVKLGRWHRVTRAELSRLGIEITRARGDAA